MYILSFDIEDWFHIFNPPYYRQQDYWAGLPSSVEQNTEWILEFLDEKNQKATFFCLGWVVEKYPGLIRNIEKHGHELAAHSFSHTRVSDLGPEAFLKDAERVVKSLEDLTGKKIDTYRAPGFSLNRNTLWAFEILNKLGITKDSSLKSGLHMGFPGIIPDEPFVLEGNHFEMKEFPTRTMNIFGKHMIYSGSGYFRLLPYSYVERKYAASNYEMAYFHPRDFDDSIHTYIKNHPFLKLKYRIGTKSSREGINKLLNQFQFDTIKTADEKTNWERVIRMILFKNNL